ncbi:MAG: glycosyltransferase family 2 protein [Bacteroidales bacterium]|jgi:glycosyltransferase involved in cell wall biosynthesis|nr:glycosyltransferase family 2 protein [Bacteroidales bacterium]
MKKVSILVPCYNEEGILPVLYDRLSAIINNISGYEWEILLVNDGSRDNTLEVIRSLRDKDRRVSYVDLSRNFGKENAMLAGFDYVTGDCTVVMDADLQDPPELMPQMLEYWEQDFDDIYAKRIHRGKESWLRKRFSLMYYNMLKKTTKIDILQNVGDFRLLDKSCIETLKKLRETERYTKGLFCWIGYRKKEIVFERGNRLTGQSAWNFKSLFNLAVEGLTSYTTAPLRISTIIGLIVSLIAFIYGSYIWIKTLLYGDPVQGYPTTMVVILFLGGIQLLSLGIIGEYLGRIFNETKGRPPYVAREYNGKKVL